MIKQSALYRERIVIPEVRRMLKAMDIHTADRFPSESDVIDLLAGRGDRDLELPLVKFVMELLGCAPSNPKDPRFDKDYRALNAAKLKGPRGGNGVEL